MNCWKKCFNSNAAKSVTNSARDRAVTADDFKALAREAGPDEIARASVHVVIAVDENQLKQVDDLLKYGPTDNVYTLDPVSGELVFGDGIHGARPPQGATIQAQYRYGAGDVAVSGVVSYPYDVTDNFKLNFHLGTGRIAITPERPGLLACLLRCLYRKIIPRPR